MKKIPFVALASLLTMTAAGQVLAQAAAPAPVAPTWGAAIPGQCVIDINTVLNTSNMGQSASQRLMQLGTSVEAELGADGEKISTEGKALEATAKTNPTGAAKTTFDGKVAAFQKKYDAFQRKQQMRKAEMQYTSQAVQETIYGKAIPYINATVTERKCSMVVQADGLLRYGAADQTPVTYVNPAMDITSTVVQKMNASNEQLPPFDRVNLEQQQQAAAAAQAQPAPKK